MFLYLLLLFTLLPFIELVILLRIHADVGLLPTLALVFGTGILGASLARWQGMRTVARIRQELADGRVPGDALVDGMLILVAGAVLLTPGVLTDICGFALLIPPLRTLLKRVVRRWFERNVEVRTQFTANWPADQASPGGPAERERIIDVEVVDSHVEDEERSN